MMALTIRARNQWTRFCNHVCTDWNTMTRPVYIDEADLSRPLFVYFACRDIQVRLSGLCGKGGSPSPI